MRQDYLQKLAKHEAVKAQEILRDPCQQILVQAGVRLNWLGDFFANAKLKWQERVLPISKILFSGTNPAWNKILLTQCRGEVKTFLELLEKKPALRRKFERAASYGKEPILVRRSKVKGKYKVLDGMHRFLRAVLSGQKKIQVYLPVNEKILPHCEAHTVYDLIRGFIRNAHDKQGEQELYYGLKLLTRTYGNVSKLLKERFDDAHVPDPAVQKIIKRVLR